MVMVHHFPSERWTGKECKHLRVMFDRIVPAIWVFVITVSFSCLFLFVEMRLRREGAFELVIIWGLLVLSCLLLIRGVSVK